MNTFDEIMKLYKQLKDELREEHKNRYFEEETSQCYTATPLLTTLQRVENSLYDLKSRYGNLFKNNDEYMHIIMGEEDWQEVVINQKLQLHITTHPDGICIDYYRYRDEITDEFDDFLGSRYFLWDDLK